MAAVVNDYTVIVVDPPWAYGRDTGRTRTAEHHYKTIGNAGGEINRRTGAGIDAIVSATPIDEWSARDCHLYLWVTNPKLPFAFDVVRAWGFEYKTTLTWVKTRRDGAPQQNGMGWFFRGGTEHVLFAVKGKKPIPSHRRRGNVVMSPTAGHSEKPGAFYDLLRSIYPSGERMLDVYARRTHEGFDAWGDQAPGENSNG